METDTSQEPKFVMFENMSNNCWLDSSMALIAHNKTIKKIASCSPNSKINEIISSYEEATCILNDSNSNIEYRFKSAKEKLCIIQTSILQYLQPIHKNKFGEPDSAFCALLNLIFESKSIKEHLNISWLWKKHCANCGYKKLSVSVKPIITLSKVKNFEPDCPTSIFVCSCKAEQEMKLFYKQLPPCLFFHFENGAGNGNNPPLLFTIQERKYQLTGIITFEKSQDSSVNHFITWIRDPFTNKWMECNDLNPDIISFSSKQPQFNLQEVYMYIFESFDNLDKLNIETLTECFQEQDVENIVEVIEISDDSEDARNRNKVNVSTSADDLKSKEKSVPNILLPDPLHNSKEDASKQLNQSTLTNTQNLSTGDEKSLCGLFNNIVHTNGGESIDYTTVEVSNLRFSTPNVQNISAIKQPRSDSVSSELNVDASSSDSFELKNAEKEDSLLDKMNVTRKDMENIQKKNTTGDLTSGMCNSNVKSLSDARKKSDGVHDHLTCQKGDKSKHNSDINKLCSAQKKLTEEQLKENANNFFKVSTVMTQPKPEKDEIIDYDELQLQQRMQQTLLKKGDQHTDRKKNKVLSINKEGDAIDNVNISETNMENSSPKTDLSDSSKVRVNSESFDASCVDDSVAVNKEINSSPNSSPKNISSKTKAKRKKKEDVVHGCTEKALAVFVEQISDSAFESQNV